MNLAKGACRYSNIEKDVHIYLVYIQIKTTVILVLCGVYGCCFPGCYVLNRITLLSLSEVKAPGFVVGQVRFQSFELLWDVLLIYVYHVKSIKVSKVGSV